MNIRYKYNYVTGLLKRYGFRGLVLKTLERRESSMLSYGNVYKKYMPTEEELQWQRENLPKYAPLVSIIVPTYETPKSYLRELIESVLVQSYPNFELCLADGSKTDAVEKVAKEYAVTDGRIRYERLEKNGGISENTNCGFDMARGEYIALMDHDDLLTPNAVYEMVLCLNTEYTSEDKTLALIYSDEDKINSDGSVHSRPHFKPDYNPEFLRHNNYFCHFLMFSAKVLELVQGLQKEFDGAQDYDFVLRCVDAGAIVRHVPKILYHWRIHEGSTAGNSADKSYAFDNGCKAIRSHISAAGEMGQVYNTPNLGVYKVDYELSGDYSITVLAEEKATLEQLQNWYGNEYKQKAYALHIVYKQVDSKESIFVNAIQTEYVWYIKKGIRLQEAGCLEGLLRHCQHKGNGAVTAKIIYRNRVASCGYVYAENGALYPVFEGLHKDYKGYFLHAVIPQNVSVISMDCTMFRKEALDRIGDKTGDFMGMYKDADISFLLRKGGYYLVATPEVVVKRLKRASAVKEQNTALQQKKFMERWNTVLQQPDPCYNINLALREKGTYKMKE